jgi:hypothetical protein
MQATALRPLLTLGALCLGLAAIAPAPAHAAPLDCDVLITQINDKLRQRGVAHYTLEAVPLDEPAAGRTVGQCQGGTRKVIYTRVPAAPAAGTTASAGPATTVR